MIYILFTLQILLTEIYVFKDTIFKSPPLLIFLVAIPSLLLVLLYQFKASKLFITLLTFIPNIYLANKNYFLNFLPFVVFYLYLLSVVKEREIKLKHKEIVLMPIIFLGLFRVNLKGILEDSILSLLYAPSSGTQNAMPKISIAEGIRNFFNSFASQTASTVRHRFWNNPRFLNVFFTISVFVYFAVLIYTFRILLTEEDSVIGKKKKRNYIQLFVISFIIITALFIVQYYPALLHLLVPSISAQPITIQKIALIISFVIAIFIIVFSKLISRDSKRRILIMDKKEPNVLMRYLGLISIMFFGLVFIVLKRLNISKNPKLNDAFDIMGILLVLVSLVSSFLYLFMLRRNSKRNSLRKFFGEKTEDYLKLALNDNVDLTLSSVEDRKEFVFLWYFILIYLLSQKRIDIRPFETPNEFFARITKKYQIPYFRLATDLFNKVKYSELEITDSEIVLARSVSNESIEYIKEITVV